jgi:dipeptidyl aminopeptidase/acylaminoacyl peptidase
VTRRWGRGLALAAVALAGGGALAWAAGHAAFAALQVQRDLRPPRLPVRSLAGAPELAGFRDVTLAAADGVTLSGWWRPPEDGAAVVLAHGWGANREQMLPQALALAAGGFGVLLLDLRAHGMSGGRLSGWGDAERLDVAAAVDFVASQPTVRPGAVGAIGFSIGALAVAEAAIADDRIRAVVLEASPASLEELVLHDYSAHGLVTDLAVLWAARRAGLRLAEVRPVEHLCRLAPRPVLIIQGDSDPEIDRGTGERLRRAACGPADLWTIPGGGHGGWSTISADLAPRLVEFLTSALAPRAAGVVDEDR